MFYKYFKTALLLTIVGAYPLYIGTPIPSLGHGYLGVNLHHLPLASSLLNQPFSMIGNSDQTGILSKGLLTSHFGGQKFNGLPIMLTHPSILAATTPQFHQGTSISFPIKKEMKFPEKTIAGALVKQVPQVSKLPIAVSFSPKPLEFLSGTQSGILEGGLTNQAPILPEKSFTNTLGISYEF